MIINAVIESKDGGTLVLDFPRSIYDVYEKLQSVGIRQSPHQITLSDEEGDDVRVKLYSEDETGKHLLLTLKEQNSLADANMLAFMVDNAKPDFRSKLEQNLLNDQYSSIKHIRKSVRKEIFDYLHSLPLNIDIEVNGQPYILVHGGAIAAYHNYMSPSGTAEMITPS